MNMDLNSALMVERLAHPATRNVSFTGTNVDIKDYIGGVLVVQEIGASSGTLLGKIQHSTDNSLYTDVSTGTLTLATSGTTVQTLGLDTRAINRYVHYVGAPTVGAVDVGVYLIGQKQVK